MKQQTSHAAAAKMIRQEMKKHGVPGRVRSSAFAGGTSVHVDLHDPMPATLEQVKAFANQFQYGHFDGMQDLYEYTNSRDDIPQVTYVLVQADYSDELRAEAKAECRRLGLDELSDIGLVLRGSFGNLWTSRKPRVAA